jgi:hypothetical protein
LGDPGLNFRDGFGRKRFAEGHLRFDFAAQEFNQRAGSRVAGFDSRPMARPAGNDERARFDGEAACPGFAVVAGEAVLAKNGSDFGIKEVGRLSRQ